MPHLWPISPINPMQCFYRPLERGAGVTEIAMQVQLSFIRYASTSVLGHFGPRSFRS